MGAPPKARCYFPGTAGARLVRGETFWASGSGVFGRHFKIARNR